MLFWKCVEMRLWLWYYVYAKQILITQAGILFLFIGIVCPFYAPFKLDLVKTQFYLNGEREYLLRLRFVWRQSELRFSVRQLRLAHFFILKKEGCPMEKDHVEILAKSKKVSQKKKTNFVWCITMVLFVAMMVSFTIDYIGYRKGQKFGVASAILAGYTRESYSYDEQCADIRENLERRYHNVTVQGVTFDYSEAQAAQNDVVDAFYDVMKSGGYTRYGTWNLAKWFYYTNPVEYFTGYYWNKVLPLVFYVFLLFALVFTFLTKSEAEKGLIVYADSVLCKLSKNKTKEFGFEDISNVTTDRKTLKLIGTGIKFKITSLKNAEELKSVIVERKKILRDKPDNANAGNADELKKYKDLLDSGVISQEEFDAKKKQLLGL